MYIFPAGTVFTHCISLCGIFNFPLFQGEIDPWSLKMVFENVLEKERLKVTYAVSTLFSFLFGSCWIC